MIKRLLSAFIVFISISCGIVYGQVSVATAVGSTPLQMIQSFLLGNGVIVSNVKFNDSPAVITTSNQIGSFSTGTPTNLGFGTGLCISTGGVQVATSGTLTVNITGNQVTSDPDLQALKPGKSLHDIARLEFDFIPSSDTVKFRYVFASNEYNSAVCTVYDDVFGFFISGANPAGGNYVNKNIALVPGTNLPVSINTINGGVSMGSATPCYLNYTQYYHTLNSNLTYLGATVPLTAWAKVVPCTSYHIKLAICDISNAIYDSGVFLEASSFVSPKLTVSRTFTFPAASDTAMIRGCNNAIVKIKLPHRFNYNYPVPVIKQGSAVNGLDYPAIPDTIYIPANSDTILLSIIPYNNSSFTNNRILKLLIKTSACDYDTLNFTILPNLPLNLNARGDTAICNLSTLHLTSLTTGGIAPYQFSWNDGDTNAQRWVQPTSTTLYKLNLKDKCLQTAIDSVLITVYPAFNVSVSAVPGKICKGETVQLQASPAKKFHWNSNPFDPSLIGQDTLAMPIVKPAASSLYFLTASDIHGCTAKDTINIYVYPPLNASIIANPNPVSIFDPSVHFIDGSSGSTQWWWNTGDGYTSVLRDFYHTFSAAASASYHVSLTVSNSNGCTDSTSLDVLVYPEIKIYFPNAFTPDVPSLNNVFKAYGEGIVEFEMFIYNRWGQLIFHSRDINTGWDGKFMNAAAEPGIYVYTAYYKDFLGKMYNKSGSLTLLR